MKKLETVPFKAELNAYQSKRAQENFKWTIREDRFTNPDSPYYHLTEDTKE